MLKLLNIGNLAVTDRLCIEFQKGLNLLTGETGSGKTIIVDALSLLFGDRLSSDKIRAGERRAWVEGVFEISKRTDLFEKLNNLGLTLEGDEVVLRREWTVGGGGRSFVNGSLVGASQLKELRSRLLEIHGQGEERALLSVASHLDLLDRFGGLEPQKAEVAQLAHRHAELGKELAELESQESARVRSIDLLQFQVHEIERTDPRLGEDESLSAERRVLAQAEKAARLASEAYTALYDDDEAICSQLGSVARKLAALTEIDPQFLTSSDQLERARATLQEIAFQLRNFGAGRDFSPERLAEVEGRLAELDRLKRKYGPELEGVVRERDRMAAELLKLESAESRADAIAQEMQEVASDYQSRATRLSEDRKSVAPKLEAAVRKELNQLALGGARFQVRLNTLPETIASRGLEDAEFMIAPNVGEGFRPLARIASGGELSRLMLALRTVIADGVPKCLVFDEVDTGVGGRAAEEIGARLKKLGRTHQVFCVTHQPQIARFADVHYRVNKVVQEGRTRVEVEPLDNQGRLDELSRMLSGAEVTPVTRRHARELIKSA